MNDIETTRRSVTLPKKLLERLARDDQKRGLNLSLSDHIQVWMEAYLNQK